MDIDARAFGNLEGEVKALREMLAAQAAAFESQNKVLAKLNDKIDALSTTMSEARGGWRTLVWIGGMSATVGGVVTWLLGHLKP